MVMTFTQGKLHHRRLLEIEIEDYHIGGSAIYALGEDVLRGVSDVVAVLLQDIAETKAELEFGDEFEEGHIDVTAETHLKVGLKRLRAELHVLGRREVVLRHHTSESIGTIIVESLRTELEVNGHGNVCGLHVLTGTRAVGDIDILDVLRPEVKTGIDTHIDPLVDLETAQHTDAEAEVLTITLCHPLLPGLRKDVAIVHQRKPLIVESDVETIVPTSGVDEGLVLYLPLLGRNRQPDGKAEHEE